MKKIFLLCLFPVTLAAQKNYPALLDDQMQAEHKVKQFNGTVLVMQKGKPIYKKSFGMADKEWNIANTNETKYRIGSVTKQFTSAAIMQLAGQGKLSVDDKLTKYFPDYPKGDSITLHMLLTHTSGIKNYTAIPGFFLKASAPLSNDSVVAMFRNKPLDFTPGSAWSYSNSGYFLLGMIIEKVTGFKYSDYLAQQVIKKAGLKNTMIDRTDSILAYRAKGYSVNRYGGWENALNMSVDWAYSAGALVSTVDDMYQWTKALHNNQVVSAASTQQMFTAHMDGYGYGLIVDSLKGHRRISHNGAIPGFTSYVGYFPQDDITIVVLSNFMNAGSNATIVGDNLSAIMYNLFVQKPYVPKEVKIDPALLDKYAGKYFITSPVEFIVKNGKFYRHREGSPDIELKPESNTRFFYADKSDRFIEFEIDKAAKVSKA